MFGHLKNVVSAVAGLQDGGDDLDAAANMSELRDVLRSFQEEQQMLKSLLRDKDNEAQHYRQAAESIAAKTGDKVSAPPPPPPQAEGGDEGSDESDESDDEAARTSSVDAQVDVAVRALRLESRNAELVEKVKGVKEMLDTMSQERSQALEMCQHKEETIEKLVNEYSLLSGEMRECGERDGEAIATLEEEKQDLAGKLEALEEAMQEVSANRAPGQQVTGLSAEEGAKQAKDLDAATGQVATLKAGLEEASARASAAEQAATAAKAEAAEARAAVAASGDAASEENAEKSAAAAEAARAEAAAEHEKALAALREQLDLKHNEALAAAATSASAAAAAAAEAAESAMAAAKADHAVQVTSLEAAVATASESAASATTAAAESAMAAAKADHAAQVTSLEAAVATASESAASAEQKMLAAQKEASLALETAKASAEKAAAAAGENAAELEASLKAEASNELAAAEKAQAEAVEAAVVAAREKHAADLEEALATAEKKAQEKSAAEAAAASASMAEATAASEASLFAAKESHAKELAAAHAKTEQVQVEATAAQAAIEAAAEEKAAAVAGAAEQKFAEAAAAADQKFSEAAAAADKKLTDATAAAEQKFSEAAAAADKKFSEAAAAASAAAAAATEEAQQMQADAVAAAEAAKDAAAATAAAAAAEVAASEKAAAVAAVEQAAAEAAAATAEVVASEKAAAMKATEEAITQAAAAATKAMEEMVTAAEAKKKAAEDYVAVMDGKWEAKMAAALEDAAKAAEASEKAAVAAEGAAKQKIIDALEKKCDEAYADYLTENKKRKAIHNKLIELQGNIRVFARCRPMVEAELRSGKCDNVAEFPTPEDIVVHRDEITRVKFEFDQVFKPNSEQAEVFSHVKPFATSFLDGYNVCIFAYGQTGSGKTYTMEGPPENRGVNMRCLEELFRIANEERAQEMSYVFVLSYLEIYNEAVHDLLVDRSAEGGGGGGGGAKKALDVRQSAEGNVVPGLTAVQVSSIDEVLALMERGAANRAVGSHDMNEHSSRSHSILTLTCNGTPVGEAAGAAAASSSGGTGGLRSVRSQLHLIDLAGSERISKTDATGDRLKEAQAINKSLSSLGDVIAALGGKKGTHVPYRNSKLTFLLQDSLSGNSKVLMFCNVSPASYNLGETMCSLNFAARCRKTELGAAKKGGDSAELRKYKMMVQKLQDQIMAGGGGDGFDGAVKKSNSSGNLKSPLGKK